MSEAARIADQHRRAFDGSAWHGPSVFEALEGVGAARAARKPLPKAHSIWEIVLHIRAWESVAHRRLNGQAVELTDEQDWPSVDDESPAAWKGALEALRETHDALNRDMEKLSDERLLNEAAGKDYTLYVLLHGAVQHALYHAGQISLLKKAGPA